MFGKNGAVRKLQEALCTDEAGNVDAKKLKDLRTGYDIPGMIRLPDEINGTKVNKDLVNKSSGNANGILNKEEVLGGMISELRKKEE